MEVNNIGSASIAGFSQLIVVKAVINRPRFLILPILVIALELIALKYIALKLIEKHGVACGNYMVLKFFESLATSYLPSLLYSCS